MSQRYETLHEAMVAVLSGRPNQIASPQEIAAEIAARDLWTIPIYGRHPNDRRVLQFARACNQFTVLHEARVQLMDAPAHPKSLFGPEDLAYWYLRLNGFLTIRDFAVHPDRGTNPETDIDILGIRFPHRAENLADPMPDDVPFSRIKNKPYIVITEVKASTCGLNKYWRREVETNALRILRALGSVPPADLMHASEALGRQGAYSDRRYHMSLLCMGSTEYDEKYARQDDDLVKPPPLALQLRWREILVFIYNRFRDYPQKVSHCTWDAAGQHLWHLIGNVHSAEEFMAQAAQDFGVHLSSRRQTLHEAIVAVLSTRPDSTATFQELAVEIASRDLWVRPSDSAYPPSRQIRARAVQYPDLFEILREARVRLHRVVS